MSETIDFKTVIPKFDFILARGLRAGLGDDVENGGQMCVETAICAALGQPFWDKPECVASSVRSYMIRINDSRWSSPAARATHLRDLGIAQLGSLGAVNDLEFTRKLASKTIKILLPLLLRSVFDSNNANVMLAADQCEQDGSCDAARVAVKAAYAATYSVDPAFVYFRFFKPKTSIAAAGYKTADAAASAASAANTDAHTAYAAKAATYAAYAAIAADAADAAAYILYTAADPAKIGKESGDPEELDKYLILSAQLALETLVELNSPGAQYLDTIEAA